ncbi:hypothetical protein ACWT_2920 [Actinoplanes sp. SE50]|uniref:hypothetical protein n=1 Tax=unclassified Actinoplanes TaxID=2626549 RepID=UPI00023EC09D|nr:MULTISPECIES: hypothetical protein [unclassified Actinoplanes]AEV83521.1 hypothetical protein ACPL_2626 [Actinoplanes sp. SE50/110]ATO82335.1 hypothetical protein ACWT_2920 [Actinoplanes sp. SE50]SLL99742.1 hypothetical protein ACSP50_2973 [Actinoplanes sp. SE50/110]
MPIAVSDAAFELVGACAHALRFALAAPLDYPYAAAGISTTTPPPALFRRVQVASPPPDRGAEPWHTGLTLDDKPFQADLPTDRLGEVRLEDGIPSLDLPDPSSIVLDRWFSVPRRSSTIAFPGRDFGQYLLSVQYWNPVPPGEPAVTRDVAYHGTYRFEFERPPAGDWIAVSFEGFWPPERDSADLLIPLGECDDNCPT